MVWDVKNAVSSPHFKQSREHRLSLAAFADGWTGQAHAAAREAVAAQVGMLCPRQPNTAGGNPVGIVIEKERAVLDREPIPQAHNAPAQPAKIHILHRDIRSLNAQQRRKRRTFQHGAFRAHQGQRLVDYNCTDLQTAPVESSHQ